MQAKVLNWRKAPRKYLSALKMFTEDRFSHLGYYKYFQAHKSWGQSVYSNLKLDVLIPTALKDADVLPMTIDGVRENLFHPIGRIFIIAPEYEEIRAICAGKSCEFVSENECFAIRKNEIEYFASGKDRSAWLYQQFLKWSADSISDQEYYLVLDADTILLSRQVYEVKQKIVFLHSDEHHQPYRDVYKRLFQRPAPTQLSFVSHQMLYQKQKIRQIKQQIEYGHHGTPWYQIILDKLDTSQSEPVSEYEIYGQWMLQNYPVEIRREYWFNTPLARKHLGDVQEFKRKLGKTYRSVSLHYYLGEKVADEPHAET